MIDREKKNADVDVKAMSTKSLLRSSLKDMTVKLESQGVIGCMKKSLTNLNVEKNQEKTKKFKAVP